MRRAWSLFAALIVTLAAGSASAADAGSDASTTKDSGVGTAPSPNNPIVTEDPDAPDAGDTKAPSTSDSGGCSLVAQPAGGASAALALAAAASLLAASRRRRPRR